MDAIIYLVTNGMIGIFIVYLLLIRERSGVYLVGLFFGYNLIEILVTNIVSFHFYGLSPLFLLGLALTTYLIIKERSRSKSR